MIPSPSNEQRRGQCFQEDTLHARSRVQIMSFGRTFSFSLLIAAACHWHFAVTAVGIGDIFNLGDNCASYQADLDTIYTEALELLTSATRAVDDGSNMLSANWEEAWRLMFTFFHDPSASDYTQIRSKSPSSPRRVCSVAFGARSMSGMGAERLCPRAQRQGGTPTCRAS